MLERNFQSKLIKDIKKTFPGCLVLKNDASYMQGIPDILILYSDKWAMLECKKSADASHQPNQDYYVKKLDEMSYSTFIFPENKKEVMDELKHHFLD